MIGFDPVGRSAIGELAGGDDVVIFAPAALAVSIALGTVPGVHGGGSALAPGATVVLSVVAPKVAGGASVLSPVACAVAVAGAPVLVTHSATVAASGAAVTIATGSTEIRAGARVAVPAAANVNVSSTAACPSAGALVEPTAVLVSIATASAMVSIGATIAVPGGVVSASSVPADPRGGQYIEVSNTITMITPYGEIGSDSIGQFAIGEGEPSTRTVKRGLLVRVGVEPPAVFAGKSVFPPARAVSVVSARAEIDSRLRRIRVYAIAS